jgi:hypothetical protein
MQERDIGNTKNQSFTPNNGVQITFVKNLLRFSRIQIYVAMTSRLFQFHEFWKIFPQWCLRNR